MMSFRQRCPQVDGFNSQIGNAFDATVKVEELIAEIVGELTEVLGSLLWLLEQETHLAVNDTNISNRLNAIDFNLIEVLGTIGTVVKAVEEQQRRLCCLELWCKQLEQSITDQFLQAIKFMQFQLTREVTRLETTTNQIVGNMQNRLVKELNEKIDGLESRLNGRIDQMNGKIDEMGLQLNGRIDQMNGKIDQMGFQLRQDAQDREDRLYAMMNGFFSKFQVP